jgi:hypothetical protein
MFFVLSNGANVSRKSEDFEQRGQWAQESEIRTIYTPENLKPFYDGGGFFVRF